MQLGWIDFSKTDRNKILSVLDLLSENRTLDELGIAPIRDGFSNVFFPGTSTIQTRAKYFFAVLYSLKQLEQSLETNPNEILKSLNEIEKRCGEILLEKNHDENGIIGKRSLKGGNWVKKTPADIYWSGLRQYGIFTGGDLSLVEYIKASCAIKSQKFTLSELGNKSDNSEGNESDDKNAGDLFKIQFWKMPLYLYDDKWLDNFCISLSNQEATFLRKQIESTCKGTMLSYVLDNNIKEFLDCNSFQDLESIIDKFPSNIKNDYRLAIKFSDFIDVIRTVYNHIISEGKNESTKYKLENFKANSNIDIDIILKRLCINNPLLRKFLKQCQDFMIANDLDGLKKCIISREIQLKGINRAKTAQPNKFDTTDSGKLDYRFCNAKTIIKDIMESEDNV